MDDYLIQTMTTVDVEYVKADQTVSKQKKLGVFLDYSDPNQKEFKGRFLAVPFLQDARVQRAEYLAYSNKDNSSEVVPTRVTIDIKKTMIRQDDHIGSVVFFAKEGVLKPAGEGQKIAITPLRSASQLFVSTAKDVKKGTPVRVVSRDPDIAQDKGDCFRVFEGILTEDLFESGNYQKPFTIHAQDHLENGSPVILLYEGKNSQEVEHFGQGNKIFFLGVIARQGNLLDSGQREYQVEWASRLFDIAREFFGAYPNF